MFTTSSPVTYPLDGGATGQIITVLASTGGGTIPVTGAAAGIISTGVTYASAVLDSFGSVQCMYNGTAWVVLSYDNASFSD